MNSCKEKNEEETLPPLFILGFIAHPAASEKDPPFEFFFRLHCLYQQIKH